MRGMGDMQGGDPANPTGIRWGAVPDIKAHGGNNPLIGRPLGQEYDGLETGELAWIMGRKFLGTSLDEATHLENGSTPFRAISSSAHMLGMGFGVDRMQRLAYTSWMEAYFRALFGSQKIELQTLDMSAPGYFHMSSELKTYEPYLYGATVLSSVDLPHVVNGIFNKSPKMLKYTGPFDKGAAPSKTNPPSVDVNKIRSTKEQDGLASGLFVVDKGPFLRGKIVSDDAVEMIAPELQTANRKLDILHTVPRNLGDRMAFESLYAQMKQMNMFDWTPDGMVLSKLESPAGEPMSSAELDARQAQLFNVCVQGPAIARTWTGDPKMAALPLDKVFVVIVADISSEVVDDNTKGAGATEALAKLWAAYGEFVRPATGGVGGSPTDYETLQIDDLKAAAKKEADDAQVLAADEADKPGKYAKSVSDLFTAQAKTIGSADDQKKAPDEIKAARDNMDKFFGKVVKDFDKDIAGPVKQGAKGLKTSVMTNFRLMRVTSSFLSNTSACVFKSDNTKGPSEVDPSSRCGLRFGMNGATVVTGEYIIGGWCIGTVIDSAASRASVGNLVKTAPASMAININVNVEWWSGDDLHRHYMDVDGTVFQRGQFKAGVEARQVKADVGLADLEEFKSWVPFGGESP